MRWKRSKQKATEVEEEDMQEGEVGEGDIDDEDGGWDMEVCVFELTC